MKKTRKISAFLICILILASVFSMTSFALSESYSNNFVVQDGVLISYSGPGGDVVIPDNLGITTLGYALFRNNMKINSVVIPNGVTLIGSDVFDGCGNLVKVSIPEGVTVIGNEAFADCSSLVDVNIPDGVTMIGNSAFHFCTSLAAILLPDTITSIGKSAFVYTALTSIALPKNIYEISDGTFIGCRKLTSINIPDSVTAIGDEAFADCTSLNSIVIPECVNEVGFAAFCDTAIPEPILLENNSYLCYVPDTFSSYHIPETVTRMSGGVFYECSKLTSVSFPAKVKTIEQFMCYNCTALRSVQVPDDITLIGDFAFYGCSSLTSFSIPKSVTYVGKSAFSYSGIQTPLLSGDGNILCYVPTASVSYTIPDTVVSISGGAFAECKRIKTIDIPSRVTTIGPYAFSDCISLKSISIPVEVPAISDGLCNGCSSLTTVNLSGGISSIGTASFANCSSLASINIPYSVLSIGSMAFENCTALKSLTIPECVKTIGDNAFFNAGLSSIYITNSATEFGEVVFYENDHLTIYGPSGSNAEAYASKYQIPFIPVDIKTAIPSKATVLVNGVAVSFEAYSIGGYNYFKLRDLAMALTGSTKAFDISYYAADNTIQILPGKNYTPVGGELTSTGNTQYLTVLRSAGTVYLDGKKVDLTAYNINGYNYFKLRDVAATIHFGVSWDETTSTIALDTTKEYEN